MIDASSVDLLALIGRDVPLERQSSHAGGEYHGPCPFCGGFDKRDADRFVVWPLRNRYWCRKCGRFGDAIDYVRARHNLSFREACDRLGLSLPGAGGRFGRTGLRSRGWRSGSHDSFGRSGLDVAGQRRLSVAIESLRPAVPPCERWQLRARAFADECVERLWSPAGARARAWLTGTRRLSEATLRAVSIGFNPADRYESAAEWGVPGNKAIYLARGITLPWCADGILWRVNIRRSQGKKYLGPAGFGVGLYRASAVSAGLPSVLVEGEFDSHSLIEVASDLATAVATGSTAGSRRAQWVDLLRRCPVVLVAFDADEAGEQASHWWLEHLPNAVRWRAYYAKDINGMAMAGGDVRAWLVAGLHYAASRSATRAGPS